MKWCQNCVLPDTRPNLEVGNDGICSACSSHNRRKEIDWSARALEFRTLVKQVKQLKREYDCIIPISGGKDSTWQVVTCIEHGLKPLTVTWRPPARTEIGAANLENLINLGVDHMDFHINPIVEAAFMRKTFELAGSPAIPMHFAIFAIPLTIAIRYDVPLVIWGENSAIEYGGGDVDGSLTRMNDAWLERYGVTQGSTIGDWTDNLLSIEDLSPYRRPDQTELEESGIQSVFLGQYFPWDPQIIMEVATKNGFKVRAKGPKTGYYDYADIDDDFISIHHWLKWYKFGFTRSFDNLALEIRNRRMTRSQAIAILTSEGVHIPENDILKFCRFTGLTHEQFNKICERFRDTEIWINNEGIWMIDDFLCNDWNWQ